MFKRMRMSVALPFQRRLILNRLLFHETGKFGYLLQKPCKLEGKKSLYTSWFKLWEFGKKALNFSATIQVDISAAEVHPGDVLEKIIEECARIGVKEFKNAEFQFEGLQNI